MQVPTTSREGYVKHGLRETLLERQHLKALVEEWWQDRYWGSPPLPEIDGIGVMARQIATFRYEDVAFAELCQKHGLTPVWLEYTGDKMSSESSFKRSLLRVHFCSGRGKNGGLQLQKPKNLADLNLYVGKPINTIATQDGLLVDFHHQHQDKVCLGAIRSDATKWVKKMGGARDYYEAFLAIFIAHAVLFEDYHGGESGKVLDHFTSIIFEPAWQAVTKRFGVSPLIYPLPWIPEFKYYPIDHNWRQHNVVTEDHLS